MMGDPLSYIIVGGYAITATVALVMGIYQSAKVKAENERLNQRLDVANQWIKILDARNSSKGKDEQD